MWCNAWVLPASLLALSLSPRPVSLSHLRIADKVGSLLDDQPPRLHETLSRSKGGKKIAGETGENRTHEPGGGNEGQRERDQGEGRRRQKRTESFARPRKPGTLLPNEVSAQIHPPVCRTDCHPAGGLHGRVENDLDFRSLLSHFSPAKSENPGLLLKRIQGIWIAQNHQQCMHAPPCAKRTLPCRWGFIHEPRLRRRRFTGTRA